MPFLTSHLAVLLANSFVKALLGDCKSTLPGPTLDFLPSRGVCVCVCVSIGVCVYLKWKCENMTVWTSLQPPFFFKWPPLIKGYILEEDLKHLKNQILLEYNTKVMLLFFLHLHIP